VKWLRLFEQIASESEPEYAGEKWEVGLVGCFPVVGKLFTLQAQAHRQM